MAFFDEARLIAAGCALRQDFRHFRADRVADLTDTGEPTPERRHALIRRWRESAHTRARDRTPLLTETNSSHAKTGDSC